MKKLAIIFLPFLILLSACNRGEINNVIPIFPEIEILDVSPTEVTAGQDEIVFTVKYTDGDGDLGTNDDNIRNVFLTDLRINVIHEFRLQQLAPDGAAEPITGNFNLSLPFTILTDSTQNSETVSFSLYVIDRSGNLSNTVESPSIRIKK